MSNLINGREIVAIDCDMVGGPYGMLARVVIVNYNGMVIYEKCVDTVSDYRNSLENPASFQSVRQVVSSILVSKVIVGYGLEDDLNALQISHDKQYRRDLATSPFLIKNFGSYGRPALLKQLADKILMRRPAEDAKAAMEIFKKYQSNW